MVYFALPMSSEEKDIVNDTKANLKLFEDVKYNSYTYLLNDFVKAQNN